MTMISDPNKMDNFRRSNFLTDPDAKKIDEVNSGTTYIGYTLPGVLSSDPYWLIKRITVSGTVTSIDYSSTNKGFNVMWDSRTGLTYY